MKCKTCGYSIPAGKSYCPGCGRVLSKAEQDAVAAENAQPVYEAQESAGTYRRPASSGTGAERAYKSGADTSSAQQEIEQNIKSIFDPAEDAPEYSDPHTYKSATARAIEYDEMFMRRSKAAEEPEEEYDEYAEEEQTSEGFFSGIRRSKDISETQKFEPVKGDYDVQQEYDEDDSAENAKKPFDVKKIMIIIAVLLGLAVIIAGTNAVGKQLGLWGDAPPAADSQEENRTMGDKAPVVNEPDSGDILQDESDFRIGTYTVNVEEAHGRLFNNHTLDNLIATIPNLTVIEITEVKDDSGKCTYGSYTGWIDMNSLVYTPDAKLPEETTTVAESTTQAETTTEAETTAAAVSHPTTTGTYTVDLKGDGQVLNVRADASTSADAIGRIADGTTVTVTEVAGDWGHITTEDGIDGWIYMIYLK